MKRVVGSWAHWDSLGLLLESARPGIRETHRMLDQGSRLMMFKLVCLTMFKYV